MLASSIDELEVLRKQCKKMVTGRAVASGGVAAVPLPGVDAAADIAMLLQLLPAINEKFGLSPQQLEGLDPTTKTLVYSIMKKMGTQMVGKMITKEIIMQIIKKMGVKVATKQVTKFVPIIGQAAAASISFAAMKTVGNAHVKECYEVSKKLLESKVSS